MGGQRRSREQPLRAREKQVKGLGSPKQGGPSSRACLCHREVPVGGCGRDKDCPQDSGPSSGRGPPESGSPEQCAPSSSSGALHGGTADGGETFPARHAWVRTSPTRAPRPGANPHAQQGACLCAAEQRPVLQPAVSGDAGATRARGRRSSRAPPPLRASPWGGNETDDGFRRRPLTPAVPTGLFEAIRLQGPSLPFSPTVTPCGWQQGPTTAASGRNSAVWLVTTRGFWPLTLCAGGLLEREGPSGSEAEG